MYNVNTQGKLKQSSIRSYISYLETKVGRETPSRANNCPYEDLEMSEIVTSEEGNRKLIVVGNDVIALFPSMREARAGGTVSAQAVQNTMLNKGLDYMEMARYCAVNPHLCGDLSEVQNLLPWRTNWGKGGRKPGMQNKEVKGKRKNGQTTWTFPKQNLQSIRRKFWLGRWLRLG